MSVRKMPENVDRSNIILLHSSAWEIAHTPRGHGQFTLENKQGA